MRRFMASLLLAAIAVLPVTPVTASLLHPLKPPSLKRMTKPPLIKPKPPKPPGEKRGLLHKK